MKNLKYILFSAFTVAVISCTYDFPEKSQLVAGQAEFSKYVAVGNSLTAGFMDGALYNRGQENSLLYEQQS